MKRVFLILSIIVSNLTLFSCTTSDVAEEITIEEVATEGEDGTVEEDNDD